MSKIKLPFTGKFGEVEGRIHIIGQKLTRPNFRFRIDTGSWWTLLMDKDFEDICLQLGWVSHIYPDIMNWIFLQKHYFLDEGYASCIAGKSDNPIFLICNSNLSLLDPVCRSPVPPRKWSYQKCVFGTFTTKFLNSREDLKNCSSHISLLGVDKLNNLKKFVWSYWRKQITLTH